jgi:hypothetical protein
MYTPNRVSPWPLRGFSKFHLPIGEFKPLPGTSGRTVYVPESRWQSYRIVVAVRMEMEERHVFVRTFKPNSEAYEVRTGQSRVLNNDWTFDEPSEARYFLLYARLECPNAFATAASDLRTASMEPSS